MSSDSISEDGEYDTEIRRFGELGRSKSTYTSKRGELNVGFIGSLEKRQRKFGGGACRFNSDYPIQQPVTLYLTGIEGDSPESGEVNTCTVTLEEGDTATIEAGNGEYRIKFYGLRMERDPAPQVNEQLAISFSIDRWSEKQSAWSEIENHTGTSDAINWSDGENTVRVVLADAPGVNAEVDFIRFVEQGLSPAEALDYWMADIRHYSQEEWAENRGKSQQAISKNVRKAREKLSEDDT